MQAVELPGTQGAQVLCASLIWAPLLPITAGAAVEGTSDLVTCTAGYNGPDCLRGNDDEDSRLLRHAPRRSSHESFAQVSWSITSCRTRSLSTILRQAACVLTEKLFRPRGRKRCASFCSTFPLMVRILSESLKRGCDQSGESSDSWYCGRAAKMACLLRQRAHSLHAGGAKGEFKP